MSSQFEGLGNWVILMNLVYVITNEGAHELIFMDIVAVYMEETACLTL